MRFIPVILALINFKVAACAQDYLDGYSAQKKFLVAVNHADFVYIGEIVRTYRPPGTPSFFKLDTGYVFKVSELLKGQPLPYMEAEQSSMCGVNSPNTENYWPDRIGDEFVVAGKVYNDENYIKAVYPLNKATYFMADIVKAANKQLNRD